MHLLGQDFLQKYHTREFPGGPVVRTPRFHGRGNGFYPWSGSRMLCGVAKKKKYHARISFSQKKEIILEFDSSHQSHPPGELNYPLTSFICSVSESIRAYSRNTDHLSLLNQLPSLFWAKSPTDVGKIHSAPPIKIHTDPSKPLPRIS